METEKLITKTSRSWRRLTQEPQIYSQSDLCPCGSRKRAIKCHWYDSTNKEEIVDPEATQAPSRQRKEVG